MTLQSLLHGFIHELMRAPKLTRFVMRKKILFVVTEDWYFVSHRLALACAALTLGYDVTVATRVSKHKGLISNLGIRVVPFELSRRAGNPFRELLALYRLYKKENPDIVHQVALKPVIFGSIIARMTRVNFVINAVSGLGWLFTSSKFYVRLFQPIIRRMLVLTLSQRRSKTIVQNKDDYQFLTSAGLNEKTLELIPGVGVNLEQFCPKKREIRDLPCIMLVARMLWDKGVKEFVEAAGIVNANSMKARFVLVGGLDLANPAAISLETLTNWEGKWGVEYWGKRDNMPEVWRLADIACLPSYREGMPKSLIEAAATGLPIVTTNVPGCREVIEDQSEGILVPARDSHSLAKALNKLVEDVELRNFMGSRSRARAKALFCEEKIISAQTKLYESVF